MTETSEKSTTNNNNNRSNTTPPSESHDELKASLGNSISTLEGYQDMLKEMMPKAKEWVNDAENKMRETTEFIREQFAMLREAIDKKEEEIMRCLEMNVTEQDGTNKLIHNAQELMCEIPTIIERVKVLFSEWDNKKEEAVDTAKEVLSIKEKVKSGEEIINKLRIFENCEMFVDTERFLRGTKRGLDEINGINNIQMKRALCSAPTGLAVDRAYSVYASLRWDRGKKFDEYVISYCEEGGGDWNGEDKLIHVDKKKDHCVVYPLKPETRYQFRVMGKINGMETRWSEAVFAKTGRKIVIPEIEGAVRELRDNLDDVGACFIVLSNFISLTEGGDNEIKVLGEAGIIDVIVNVMKKHINNVVLCVLGCGTICVLTANYDNRIIAGQCGAIDVILNAMKTHINSADVCENGCDALRNITNNVDNQIKAEQCGAIEVILNVMKTHTSNADVCYNACSALKSITAGQCGAINAIVNAIKTHINNADVCERGCNALESIVMNVDNQVIAGECGAIDVILNVMRIHINTSDICYCGCAALWNISEGNCFTQKEVCEKGGLTTLLEILRKYNNITFLFGQCYGAIGIILSSQEIRSKFCTQGVLDAVRECYEKHKDFEKIKQFFLGLTREEDPRVRDAVLKGVCTKDAFPKCGNDHHYYENYYCPKCCVQQKAFRCHTCDKGKIVFYCEVCWKKHHQGHECEEFFYPVRCATK